MRLVRAGGQGDDCPSYQPLYRPAMLPTLRTIGRRGEMMILFPSPDVLPAEWYNSKKCCPHCVTFSSTTVEWPGRSEHVG